DSAVVFDVSGAVEFLRTVRIDSEGNATIDGSVSLGPAVTLALDWDIFHQLACGRVRPAAVAEQIKIDGDQELADAILNNFALTPCRTAAQPEDLSDAARLQDEDRGEGDPVVVAGRIQQDPDGEQGRHRRGEAAHVDDAGGGALALGRVGGPREVEADHRRR